MVPDGPWEGARLHESFAQAEGRLVGLGRLGGGLEGLETQGGLNVPIGNAGAASQVSEA